MEYTKLLGKVTLTCDGKHDSSKEYDRLCLVYDEQYRSFISIKEVPSNISLTNESYWQPISVVYADGEDIKVDDDLSLKFADKEYNPSKYSGLGRKILRKRIVNNKNILLQTDFDSSDTIYVIQYEFDLQGKTITIPNNSILSFEGGKFVNGDIVLNDTMILPQGIDVAEHIEGNVTGTYKDGQIYYDSIKDSLIAVVNNNKIDLSTPNITNEYTKFTWIKYSPSQYGDQMTDQPEEDSQYIGIASNKETEEPSNNPLDYVWAKFVGPQGAQGLRGERGFQGPQGEQGPPGKDGLDGKPGQSVKPNWNTWVFKQAELQPSKPTFVTPTPGVSGIDGWFDGPSAEGKWWMSMGLVDGSTNTVATWSDPVQCTAEDGKTNTYMDFKYSKSVSINIIPALNKTSRNPVGWEDTPPTLAPGEFMWMINALIDENNELVKEWQGPIRITGEQGPQGEPGQGEPGDTYNTVFAYKSSVEKPEKPVGGEWDADTNIIVYPEGWSSNDEELIPPVWMSNKVFTSNPNIQGEWSEPIKISGQDGAAGTDGNSVEFIYTRTTDSGVGDAPETPVGEDVDDFIPLNWTDNPKGVTPILKAEWVSTRSKKDNKWGGFSTPALWSKWGENGQDGDGVQYIFYRTATNNDPDNPTPNNTNSDAYQETGDFEGIEYIPGDGWTDNPQGVTKELQYEWVCQRKFRGGRWRAYTGPSLWAKYGKDGLDGLGSIVLDLDNEVQSVATDNLGAVISGLPVTTKLTMYYGTTELNLSSLSVRQVNGITATADRKTGIITVSAITPSAPTNIRIPIDASCVWNNELIERTTYLTINKIKPGADGQDAILYSLVPSVDAMHVDKKGVADVKFISCGIKKTQGKVTTMLTSVPTGFQFKYVIDEDLAENYTIDQNLSVTSIDKKVTFLLTSGETLVDKETVFKISDGKDGEDGQPGTVPNWKTYVYKQSNTKPDKPTFRVPQPGGLDGWVDFPDSSTGQWWQCIGLVYGETNSVHVWGEVVPLNGKDGVAQDGKYTEFRFKAVTTGYSPGTPQQVRNPAGWNTTVPSVDESIETLWMIMAVITPNDALESGWSTPVRISGETGQDGEPGATLYTWIKYSDNEPTSDADIYDTPNRYTKYIGIAYNKTSPVESTDYEVYEWTKWVGADGNKGRIIYPVGTYSDSKTYTCTDEKAPYVFFNDEYYVMNKNGNWLGTSTGKTPEQDWNTNGSNATWILMDKYEALFTKILIADGGSMGKFIFNGDYMFSQEGVDGGGNATSNYQNFTNNTVNFTNHFTMPSDSNWVDEVSIETYKVTVRNAVVSMMWGVNTDIVSTTKQTPEFKIKVKGVKTYPSATVQLQYKYIKNGNLEYIQMPITSSTVEYTLPASEAGSGGDYTTSIEIAQFGTGSLSVSFEFYISSVFIPNFMVNAVTGQVDMNKGVIRMRSAEEYDKLYYSQITGSTSVYRPNITSNKQLMVIDDVGATDYTISLPFNDAYEGMSLYIFYTSTTGTGNYALRVVTENSQSDLPGGVGKFLYNGSLSLSIITLTPNKFVQLKYTNMASGYVMSGGTVVPFNCPAWMVENGSDFQKQI